MRHLLLAAALLAAPASAATREEAQGSFETAVLSYIASKGHGEKLVVRMRGKPLPLTLDRVETATVHRAGGRWRAVADFKDGAGKRAYWADVAAGEANGLWTVKEFRWLSKRELGDARLAALDAADDAKKPKAPGPQGQLPDLSLPTLDGKDVSLADCAKDKCLTVVVAPWCPHCRNASGVIAALGDFLPERGVGVRVVVAADSEEHVRDFAEKFGPNTLVDPDSQFKVPGFPCYIVSTDGGAILKQTGAAPENEKDPALFASALGLP